MSGIPAGLGSPDVPDWAPTNEQIADYVPHRTLSRSLITTTEGADVYRYLFDDDTRPTGMQVDRLIGDGVAWVASRVSPLATVSQGAARVCSVLYAAAAVERAFPNDDQSLQRANDMEKRLDVLMADLVVSNTAANADIDGDPATINAAVLPMFSFPPADLRYDDARYF